LALYGGAFLLYAAALGKLPLNVAHPVLTSGAIAIVALFSVLIFREQFYWTTGAGILLVIVGGDSSARALKAQTIPTVRDYDADRKERQT
jgi:drug/metabolite transporter (DMT)-like permease